MCQQKNSEEASLREEKAYLDCLITINLPEVGLEGLFDLSTMCNVSTLLWSMTIRTKIGLSACPFLRSGSLCNNPGLVKQVP